MVPGPGMARAMVCWAFDEEERGSLNVEMEDEVLGFGVSSGNLRVGGRRVTY